MRISLAAAVLPLALIATHANAGNLELKLNDSMAEFNYFAGAANAGLQDGELGFGFLFNEDNDLVGTVSFVSSGRMDESLSFSIGVKSHLVHVDTPSETLVTFGLGAGVGYTLRGTPITLSANGFVAPNILTFGDASGLTEWELRAQAQVLPNAAVFVGWRALSVDLDTIGNYDVDDAFHVGLQLRF